MESANKQPDNFYWYKTDTVENKYESSFMRNDKWLALSNVNASNGGWYMCCAIYNDRPGSRDCSSAYLNVMDRVIPVGAVEKNTWELSVMFVILIAMIVSAFVAIGMFFYKKLVVLKDAQEGSKHMNTVRLRLSERFSVF